MKKILTLRGVCSAGRIERIMSFDSNAVGYGWKVLDFKIMTNQHTAHTADDYTAAAALGSTSEQFTFNDWDESTMIGVVNVSKKNVVTELLDYNHVIVNSLYISNYWSDAVNYLVVLEAVDISPQENIIYRLKERAQNMANE